MILAIHSDVGGKAFNDAWERAWQAREEAIRQAVQETQDRADRHLKESLDKAHKEAEEEKRRALEEARLVSETLSCRRVLRKFESKIGPDQRGEQECSYFHTKFVSTCSKTNSKRKAIPLTLCAGYATSSFRIKWLQGILITYIRPQLMIQ